MSIRELYALTSEGTELEKDQTEYVQLQGWIRTNRAGKNVSFIALNDGTYFQNAQIVYSPHDYGPRVYEQPWFKDGFTYESLYKDAWLYKLVKIQAFAGKISICCVHAESKPARVKDLLQLDSAPCDRNVDDIIRFFFRAWMKESACAYFFFADQTRGRVISEFFRMVYICSSYHIPAVRAVSAVNNFFGFESVAAFLSDVHTGRIVR